MQGLGAQLKSQWAQQAKSSLEKVNLICQRKQLARVREHGVNDTKDKLEKIERGCG